MLNNTRNKSFDDVWDRIVVLTRKNNEDLESSNSFPYVTDENGMWRRLPVDQYATWDREDWSHGNWFCGFWIGILWVAFELSRNDDERHYFRSKAEDWAERMRMRQHDPNSHDIGYLFAPSYVKGYLITQNPSWRSVALTAAHVLAGRFDERIGIVQAWGRLDEEIARGTSTTDTMMNLPLLWWAARETGSKAFREVAVRHARTSAGVYVREDGSTYHTARFDPMGGKPQSRGTYQGQTEDSCWSRGQSWAIAGFAEAYRNTGDRMFLEVAETVSEYYCAHAPDDLVPYWDYMDPNIPESPRDSAAAAIASGGFLTLAEVHPDRERRARYRDRAGSVLKSLLDRYFNAGSNSGEQGILRHACYSKPHNDGVDSSFITGDYFFVQNLMRAYRNDGNCTSPFEYGEPVSIG